MIYVRLYTLLCVCSVPPVQPNSVHVIRHSGRRMSVSWSRLPPEEAQGFVTHYTIHYKKHSVGNKVHGKTVNVTANTSNVTLGDLDSTSDYIVRIWANTHAGRGMPSKFFTVMGELCPSIYM